MPFRRSSRYRKRSSRFRRFRQSRRRQSGPARSMGPLAIKQRARLVYADQINLNPGAVGLPATHVFSCNGLYDPDQTGVGHQPRGWDELISLYDHAVVIGAKMQLSFANADATNSNMLAVLVKDNNIALTDQIEIMENRYVRWATMGQEDGNSTGKLTIKLNPNKFLGRSKPLSDPDLKNSITSNPAEGCFFHISAMPTPAAIDTGAVYIQVRIIYDCVFIEPKQPGQS